jgi:hypothetical protein
VLLALVEGEECKMNGVSLCEIMELILFLVLCPRNLPNFVEHFLFFSVLNLLLVLCFTWMNAMDFSLSLSHVKNILCIFLMIFILGGKILIYFVKTEMDL